MKIILLLLPLFLLATNPDNRLQYESSPYLLQHQDNPVNWMPWGEVAFKKAQKEHKPIFLSIGYSTCHWCHVMAHESFEDKKIAALINRDYIAIKVDKEELSHVDSYYQQLFLKLKHRSGGWPLTVLLSEKKETFFIAGYLPPHGTKRQKGLDTLLPYYADLCQHHPQEIREAIAFINNPLKSINPAVATELDTRALLHTLQERYDDLFYGFNTAPKFPEAAKLELFFELNALGEPKAKEMALQMLKAMAMRGLYDHVDGGFFRYSTDGAWEIPHFEKMLYNQAELVPLYVKAYQKTDTPLFKDVVKETLAMVEKHFSDQQLFFSASDADTQHEEGGYFTFTLKEVKTAAQNDKALLSALDLSDFGNFEGKIHLNFYSEKRPEAYDTFKARLAEVRKKRVYPFIDKKVITAWNMMMVSAYARASELDEHYKSKAVEHFEAIFTLLYKEGHLYHYTINGISPTQPALLEDYAYSIKALIDLYEVTYNKHYLTLATTLTTQATQMFYTGGEWYLSKDRSHVKTSLRDKYYTSAYAVMMQDLLRMASLTESLSLQNTVDDSLRQRRQEILQDPAYAPASVTVLLMQKFGLVLLKNDIKTLKKYQHDIEKINYPYLLTKPDESGLFLACKLGSCFAYSKDFIIVKEAIEKEKRRLLQRH